MKNRRDLRRFFLFRSFHLQAVFVTEPVRKPGIPIDQSITSSDSLQGGEVSLLSAAPNVNCEPLSSNTT
jgi:hypothetical protein